MILFDIDKLVYSSKVADQYLELSRKRGEGVFAQLNWLYQPA